MEQRAWGSVGCGDFCDPLCFSAFVAKGKVVRVVRVVVVVMLVMVVIVF